ncbi:MAG TPA: hypothetical protein VG820_12020 [Fimbriimonadaceae bacterium]|nr:hypothetical protein [Fimbriimonadaceae bacterium]
MGAALLISLFMSAGRREDVTVYQHFESGRGQVIDGLGVCDITPDHVDCWDMSGKRSAALSDLVRSKLVGESGIGLRAKYGRKNRYLVIRLSNPKSIGIEGPGMPLPMAPSGDLADWLVWRSAEAGERFGQTRFTVSADPVPRGEIPFGKGRKRLGTGISIDLGAWSDAASPNGIRRLSSVFGVRGPTWQWPAQEEGLEPDTYLIYQPVGADDKPIVAVDQQGNPVSARVYDEWLKSMKDKGWRGVLLYQRIRIQPIPFFDAAVNAYETNLNPKHIVKLRISTCRATHVLMTGFPLDPQP